MENTNKKLSKSIKIALLGAIAAILMILEVPIIPAFQWLKLDFSELPVLLGGFAFGPLAAIVVQGLKIILKVLTVGTTSGFVGEIANFVIGLFFVLPAAIIYKKNKSKKGAIIGMAVGGLFMEVAAIITNLYFLLPAFNMNLDKEAATQYVLWGLIPLNTIKAVSVSLITFFIYKKASKVLFKKGE